MFANNPTLAFPNQPLSKAKIAPDKHRDLDGLTRQAGDAALENDQFRDVRGNGPMC
jgi:hypothetical protein